MRRRDLLLSAAAAGVLTRGAAMANMPLYVPPEENPHTQTFMMWPVSRQVYPDVAFLKDLQSTIANIANIIAAFEPVVVLADAVHHAQARRRLSADVALWDIPTEDLWARDAGPLFAWQGNELVVSHIQFNGWGNKQVHQNDSQIAQRIADRLGIRVVPSGLIGEAGGVEHDGYGLLMAHESSWINKNRNPNLPKSKIEEHLLTAYGASEIIWSPGVYGEDITDYHIDSLARFTGNRRAIINLPDNLDLADPFHRAAVETHETLVTAGLDVEIILEPEKPRVKSFDFVASYANYYACNGAVIAAQFGDTEIDAIAKDALHRHYPEREIITLNVDALGKVGGGIHCATQQMPA